MAAEPRFGLAGVSFLASCAVGLGVRAGVVQHSRLPLGPPRTVRRHLHPRRRRRQFPATGPQAPPAGSCCLPAVPLAALPPAGSSSIPRHATLAAAAAPFFSRQRPHRLEVNAWSSSTVVFNRKTTNGPFRPDKVREEHQQLLMKVASAAPSQFNSQPWRFVLIEERETINRIAQISGASMTKVMAEGTFFERYKKYFRFSRQEMDDKRSGMLFDQLPPLLRPFTKEGIYTVGAVPHEYPPRSADPRRGEPPTRWRVRLLLVGVLLDRAEYRPGQLSAFYSVFSMGAATENLWLATVELGMGIQFVSFPMEAPENWKLVEELLEVPDDLQLMAVYRLGYLPETQTRPAIDWSSRERKRASQYVFRGTCATPQAGWD